MYSQSAKEMIQNYTQQTPCQQRVYINPESPIHFLSSLELDDAQFILVDLQNK